MRIISYEKIMALPPVAPGFEAAIPACTPLDLPRWQQELIAVAGNTASYRAFQAAVIQQAGLAFHEGHPGGRSGSVFLLPDTTIFGCIYRALHQQYPHFAESDILSLTDRYLTAAFLQPYRTCRPAEASATVRHQALLALHLLKPQKVLFLPPVLDQVSPGEQALLQRVVVNLRQLQTAPKVIFFRTCQPQETLLLANRILVLHPDASGRIGDMLPVPFAEPRHRALLLQLPAYKALQRRLHFLLTDALASRDQLSVKTLTSFC